MILYKIYLIIYKWVHCNDNNSNYNTYNTIFNGYRRHFLVCFQKKCKIIGLGIIREVISYLINVRTFEIMCSH